MVTLRLNPDPSRTEGSGTRKFNGFRFWGGVKGWATRHPEIQRLLFGVIWKGGPPASRTYRSARPRSSRLLLCTVEVVLVKRQVAVRGSDSAIVRHREPERNLEMPTLAHVVRGHAEIDLFLLGQLG